MPEKKKVEYKGDMLQAALNTVHDHLHAAVAVPYQDFNDAVEYLIRLGHVSKKMKPVLLGIAMDKVVRDMAVEADKETEAEERKGCVHCYDSFKAGTQVVCAFCGLDERAGD